MNDENLDDENLDEEDLDLTPINPHVDLIELIKKLALRRGKFTLSSGEKSNYYLDLRRLTLHADGLAAVVEAFTDLLYEMKDRGVPYPDAVAGPCIGADPIVAGLLIELLNCGRPNTRGGLVRKEPKDHGADPGSLIIGSIKPKDKVWLVEDVVTSGESMLRAADELEKFGCEIILATAIVDRGGVVEAKFDAREIRFDALLTPKKLGL